MFLCFVVSFQPRLAPCPLVNFLIPDRMDLVVEETTETAWFQILTIINYDDILELGVPFWTLSLKKRKWGWKKQFHFLYKLISDYFLIIFISFSFVLYFLYFVMILLKIFSLPYRTLRSPEKNFFILRLICWFLNLHLSVVSFQNMMLFSFLG